MHDVIFDTQDVGSRPSLREIVASDRPRTLASDRPAIVLSETWVTTLAKMAWHYNASSTIVDLCTVADMAQQMMMM